MPLAFLNTWDFRWAGWKSVCNKLLLFLILLSCTLTFCNGKKRSVDDILQFNPLTNNIDFIWSEQQVAAGDTAVLHCSFDAIFSKLRTGQIDWVKEGNPHSKDPELKEPILVATGKKVVLQNRRYRVYRPHNSALSVLMIRRAKDRDAGIYRCNLSGSSTRHKYLILNVTESKIEAQTSPARMKSRVGKDVTLWCNATGYPRPVVYWTREDSNRKLPDGTYQFWGNGLRIEKASESHTGIYACYLDNFVQPVVTYRFSLAIEDRPWRLEGFKMRFDGSRWYSHDSKEPKPIQGKSFLLMCEIPGNPKPLPKIRWFKDDREIRNNKHFYIIEDKPAQRSSFGKVTSTLVIMKFVPRQRANYTCHASNQFRAFSREFVVNAYESHEHNKNIQGNDIINNIPSIDSGTMSLDVKKDNYMKEEIISNVIPPNPDEENYERSNIIYGNKRKSKVIFGNNKEAKVVILEISKGDKLPNKSGKKKNKKFSNENNIDLVNNSFSDDEDYVNGSGSGGDDAA